MKRSKKKIHIDKAAMNRSFDLIKMFLRDVIKHPERLDRIKNKSTVVLVPIAVPKKQAA